MEFGQIACPTSDALSQPSCARQAGRRCNSDGGVPRSTCTGSCGPIAWQTPEHCRGVTSMPWRSNSELGPPPRSAWTMRDRQPPAYQSPADLMALHQAPTSTRLGGRLVGAAVALPCPAMPTAGSADARQTAAHGRCAVAPAPCGEFSGELDGFRPDRSDRVKRRGCADTGADMLQRGAAGRLRPGHPQACRRTVCRKTSSRPSWVVRA